MPRTAKKIDEPIVAKATEKPVTEKHVTEKPVTDKPVTEKPATNKIGGAKPATEKPASTEEPEVCSICYEEFDGVKNEMCMHEVQTSERKIQHKCHETCGIQWIKSCVRNGITPFCPMCPTVKIQYKKEKIPIAKQNVSRYEAVALTRFEELSVNWPTLFGIMVCIDNHYVKCYVNTNMMLNANRLNANSCLNDIKQFILLNIDEIYASTGPLVTSKIRFNLNYQNWKEWKYPKVRIADAHFAIPPYTDKIGLFREEALDDNSTLGELYVRYQTLAGEMYRYPPIPLRPNGGGHKLGADIEKALSNIYMDKIVHRDYPTGPDDPGYNRCAFINPENPEDLTAYGFKNATHNSVSWIAVHLEYE